jgi:hypothetical protein
MPFSPLQQSGLAEGLDKQGENLWWEERRIFLVFEDSQLGLAVEQPFEPMAGLLDTTEMRAENHLRAKHRDIAWLFAQ